MATHGSGASAASGREGRLALLVDVPAPYRIPVFNHLADQLGSRFRVFFMARRDRGRRWEVRLDEAGFEYEFMRGIDLCGWSRGRFGCYLNPGVGRALRGFAPRVVVVGSYSHPTAFLAAWRVRHLPSKLALWCESTLHDARRSSTLVERLKAWFIGRCDGFIVPGRASREYLGAYGIGAERIFLAPNAVDSDFFRDGAAAAQTAEARRQFRTAHGLPNFNVLFVGRLSPEKGFPVAVDVVEKLQAQGSEVGLLVVGDGPMRHAYEQLVSERRLRHVVFVGFVQQRELPFYYGQGDVLLVPSKSEPWGLVVNEAMACGVPVLCSTSVGAGYDLVTDGVTGYRCDTSEEYAARIRELVSSPALLTAMAGRCREAIGAFSPAACALGFLKLLDAPSAPPRSH